MSEPSREQRDAFDAALTVAADLVESWRAAPEPRTKWRPMSSAPQDGTTILGRYDDRAIPIRWAEDRVCMLASTASGAGAFGPGWEDVDNGLYIDAPEAWRPSAVPEPPKKQMLRAPHPVDPHAATIELSEEDTDD
jgi:hypothetical protein